MFPFMLCPDGFLEGVTIKGDGDRFPFSEMKSGTQLVSDTKCLLAQNDVPFAIEHKFELFSGPLSSTLVAWVPSDNGNDRGFERAVSVMWDVWLLSFRLGILITWPFRKW